MKMGGKQEQNPNQKITFFKVLIGDFVEKIMIPPPFVMKYKKIMPQTLTLKSYNVGKSYAVSVINNEDGCFFKKGWKNFVKENYLEVGDFLVFNFVGDAAFEVFIYGSTCCLKKINLADSGDHEDQNKNQSSKFTSITTATGSKKASLEKRDRPKKVIVEDSAAKTGGKARRRRNFKGKTEVIKGENMAEKEETNHLCVKFVLKDYNKYILALPRRFAVETGLVNTKKTVIKDPVGRVWPVFIKIIGGRQVHFSTGWCSFHQANRLVSGNTVALHFMQEKGNVVHAEIYKGGKDAETENHQKTS